MVVPLSPSAFRSRQEPLWVPAGLLAVLVTLVSALGAFGGEVSDSGWKSTAPTNQLTPSRRVQQFRPATAPRQAPAAQQVNRGKLRLVAFDPDADNGRASHGGVVQAQHGSARLQSIVVDQNGQRRGYRIAQDDDLLEGFQEPFGADDAPAGDSTPDFGEPMIDEPIGGEPTFDEELPPLDNEMGGRDPFDEPDDKAAAPSPSDDRDFGGLRDVPKEDLGRPAPRRDTKQSSASDYQKAMQNCSEELAELKASRIAQIDLQIHPTGSAGEDFPIECGIDDGTPFADRQWDQVCYMWKASALCHKPLYFEDVQLERYGHSWGPAVQPIVSGVHFFTRIPAIPYMMGIQAPNECVYTLGHYRPGSCAPYLIEPIPFTWRAAAMQGAAVSGVVFGLP
ncbi:hypothetical protein Pla123a_07940 [Posidoniimonas polymericola]|uniref:Uncharacterized protein n=1 Tax=Posidoniimonas polymericola TaxID=2528002 RepID=A0A5C5ZFL3_9BACT|nr:hypothetical protein Pla123a_07940 [Posidoniimonas polymericola]